MQTDAMTDPDTFIARQLAGLRELGLSEEALQREEALLRSGFLFVRLFKNLLSDPAPDQGKA